MDLEWWNAERIENETSTLNANSSPSGEEKSVQAIDVNPFPLMILYLEINFFAFIIIAFVLKCNFSCIKKNF